MSLRVEEVGLVQELQNGAARVQRGSCCLTHCATCSVRRRVLRCAAWLVTPARGPGTRSTCRGRSPCLAWSAGALMQKPCEKGHPSRSYVQVWLGRMRGPPKKTGPKKNGKLGKTMADHGGCGRRRPGSHGGGWCRHVPQPRSFLLLESPSRKSRSAEQAQCRAGVRRTDVFFARPVHRSSLAISVFRESSSPVSLRPTP